MSSNVYCPFCGVILLPDPYRDNPGSPRRRRPWYAEVRGIYSTDSAGGHASITGRGILRRQKYLHAPLDRDLSYVDDRVGALEEWMLCEQPSGGRWCFGIHDACWKLLLHRLTYPQEDHDGHETAIAEAVFYQLYCTPCLESSRFQFGHDYEGAAQTHKAVGRPAPVDTSSPFYANPCAIPSTEELGTLAPDIDYRNEAGPCAAERSEPNCDRRRLSSPNTTRVDKLEPPKHHIFDRLSPELSSEILSYLSFDEVLNLRLVCRDLALLARTSTRPRSYWRSRFLLGQEADFIFPDLTTTQDWSRLFFGTRASLRAGHLSLVNRKRVRQLLEPIATLVDLWAVFRNGPSGSPLSVAEGQDSYLQLIDGPSGERQRRLMQTVAFLSGQLASVGTDSPLDEGCRVLYRRGQPVAPPQQEQQQQQKIGISTVRIGARIFIAGINLFQSGEGPVGRLVGYHNPASEKFMGIPPSSQLEALRLAFCSEGLRGIELIFTNSDSSGWFGESEGSGIAHGTVVIPGSTDRLYLLAGLDRFKIVSLGLSELTDCLETRPQVSPQGQMDSSPIKAHLWTPQPPQDGGVTMSSLLPSLPSRAFEPLTNIDFGGPRGGWLGSLTRIVLHMVSSPFPLVGMEMSYSDGSSVLYGSNGGCEISLFVDGVNGERINGLGALVDSREHHQGIGLGGLQLSTNYGRSAAFAPLQYRLSAPVEPISISPPDKTITGFVALELGNHNRFIRIGVQCQDCDEQPISSRIPDPAFYQTPDDQIRYDEIFSHFIDSSMPSNYQTYASLRNVRRIQASMGIRGRSRSPRGISGLKLHYYNHPSPAVVGQWMDELENGLDLSLDEEVQSISIWLTPMGFSSECRGVEVGQVAAMHIETTHSRSVTFRSPGFPSLPPRKLHHQYQSNSGEKLTAIAWILNVSYDRVRAVISAHEHRRAPILVPGQTPPFDQVRKLYFEVDNDDGSSDALVTAEAYYSRYRTIIGLAFVYASGKRVSLGDLDTSIHRTVHFPPDARVVGLSAAARGPDLVEIGFKVEINAQLQYTRLSLSTNPHHGPAGTGAHEWRDVWRRSGPSPESGHGILVGGRLYKAPSDSKLVGLYVGCQEFSRVGALYEPEIPL